MSKRIKCLVIEDEPLASDLMEEYINELPFLELVGKAETAVEAISLLKEKDVNLIFLDLHLPGLKGFDILKTMSHPPKVIVTTAYHQYALESYEFGVLDYLLKPIAFERFLKAVNKLALDQVDVSITSKAVENRVLLVKEGRSNVPVNESDIVYIESQKDYLVIHTPTFSVRTKSTMIAFQERLKKTDFIRIHKSFIVRKAIIKSFNSKSVVANGVSLPVGRNFVDGLNLAMSEKSDEADF